MHAIFEIGAIWTQSLYLTGGLILAAIGTGLIGWFLYDHLWWRRVRGRIAAVRLSGDRYDIVYEYEAPDGSVVRAGDGSSSSWLGNKSPGTPVSLYVSTGNPERVARAGVVRLIVGVLVALPGILLIRSVLTSSHFPLLVVLGVLGFVAYRIRRMLKPKQLRETKEQFRARQSRDFKHVRELTIEKIRARREAQAKTFVFNVPAMSIVAAGLIGLGIYLGHDTARLESTGERAEGRIIRMESSADSSGSGYIYYPVVSFEPAEGGRREFRDASGSSHPMHGPGDRVTVLYDARQAVIDHGIWNWAIPGGCTAIGLFLAAMVVRRVRLTRPAGS